MEQFIKGAIGTLSFLFVIFFCFADEFKEKRRSMPAVEPNIQSVRFEQVPATIKIGENHEQKKFSRITSK